LDSSEEVSESVWGDVDRGNGESGDDGASDREDVGIGGRRGVDVSVRGSPVGRDKSRVGSGPSSTLRLVFCCVVAGVGVEGWRGSVSNRSWQLSS